MDHKIVIERVGNGWIIFPDEHNPRRATNANDVRVARTPDELATLVKDWAEATNNGEPA